MKDNRDKKEYLVLAINPGSTSTKAAVYKNEDCLVCETFRHDSNEFGECKTILDQKGVRLAHILDMLKRSNIPLSSIDATVGRGGLLKPIDSGTYLVNDKMLKDLISDSASVHASALGGLMAADIGRQNNIPAYVVDPVVVDEMEQVAKLTGIPGIERRSAFHALNAKAVVRKCAADLGMRYEDGRFVVAHMGGGITVGAHRYGRVIDVNDAIAGEGAFTPERCGEVPLAPVIEMCYSGKFSKEKMLSFLNRRGGMAAYLGTNDLVRVEKLIRQGDEYAALVVDSMAYQVAKEIGAMMAVLDGRVDAIVLTGGLSYSTRFTGSIKQRVGSMAKVLTYPGEDELAALAEGTLRVLRGEEQALNYE